MSNMTVNKDILNSLKDIDRKAYDTSKYFNLFNRIIDIFTDELSEEIVYYGNNSVKYCDIINKLIDEKLITNDTELVLAILTIEYIKTIIDLLHMPTYVSCRVMNNIYDYFSEKVMKKMRERGDYNY